MRTTIFLFIIFAISSCTVEKRLYTKGFHVEFRKPVREVSTPAPVSKFYADRTEELASKTDFTDSLSESGQTAVITSETIDPENITAEPRITPTQTKNQNPGIKTRENTLQSPCSERTIHTDQPLKDKQIKSPRKEKKPIDWDMVVTVALCIGLAGLLTLLILGAFYPVYLFILQVILAGIGVAIFIWFIFWICNIQIEWFWSGR